MLSGGKFGPGVAFRAPFVRLLQGPKEQSEFSTTFVVPESMKHSPAHVQLEHWQVDESSCDLAECLEPRTQPRAPIGHPSQAAANVVSFASKFIERNNQDTAKRVRLI